MTSAALLTPRNARLLLGVSLAASGVLLLAWHANLTFGIDDWDLLLRRRGFSVDVFLDPHARHLIIGPTIIYKAIQATLGMDGYLPYAVVAIAAFLASVVALFAYVERRVGAWVAVAAVLPILFMGTAYEDLLRAFQVGYFGSMAFGIAALLAIERHDPRGDVLACALLLASLAFAEIAIAFGVAVALAIAIQGGPIRRGWVVAVPALLYLIWFLAWGQQGPSELTAEHVATSPSYVLNGFASSLGSLLGLGMPALFGGTGGLDWGRPLLVLLVTVAVGWLIVSPSRRQPWILVALAVGLTFWFLTGANAGLGRPPNASRYQYVGAVALVMIAAELGAGWRPGWRGVLAVFAVAGAAALGNLSTLHQAYKSLAGLTPIVRGSLGGLEIAARTANPDLLLTEENSNFNYFAQLRAGPYLSAAEKFGSPAYSEAELAGAPENARVAADKVLNAALPISLLPGARRPPAGAAAPRLVGPARALVAARRSCLTVRAANGAAPVLELPRGGASLTAPPGVRVGLGLRRFATESFPVSPGRLRRAGTLAIPPDLASEPWALQLFADGPVTVCGE